MSGNGMDAASPRPQRRDAGLRIYPLPKPWIDECTSWLKEWTENWSCSVPTCTLPAEEVHHFQFRSQGGGDEEENLGGLCTSHHDYNHEGRISVTGRAGTRLLFKLGIRNGIPLEVFVRKE